MENLTDPDNIRIQHHVNQAIKAWGIMHRDQDYVVKDGEVIIVDEFTGRLMYGRRYNEGLHQAIEAKEGVEVARESRTLATITFQNYFRLYDKLSGMTGTAMTEQEEFSEIYKLDVVEIPTNRPMIREDCPDVVYKTEQAKFQAVIDDIVEHHQKGQPVLVGTITIEKSELLSKLLKARGVKHEVLNAKFHEKEAQIVAQAGRKGAVTIATNMAGRGTDILLGGNAEFMAKAEMRKMGYERGDAGGGLRLQPHRGRGDPGGPQDLRGAEQEVQRGDCPRGRGGPRTGRPVHHRHRAPRVPPHRQPAAGPCRPPGRPRQEPVLHLPGGRPDAPVRRRAPPEADGQDED